MDPGGVLACGQLIEEFLVLVSNTLPVIHGADAIGCAAAIVLRQLGLVLYKLDFLREIVCITEEQPVGAQHFSIERIGVSKNAIAISQRLQQRGIGPTHHVAMNVSIGITVELLHVLNAVYVA